METQIINFIQNNLRSPQLDSIMIFFTNISEYGAVWLTIGAFLIFTSKYKNYGIMLIISLALVWIIGEVALKNLIGRMRPFYLQDINLLITKPKGFSFPSGHSASSFAAAFIILKINKRIGIFAMMVASAIAFSRVYLYVHYPSDVISGMFLGLICGSLVYYIFTKKQRLCWLN